MGEEDGQEEEEEEGEEGEEEAVWGWRPPTTAVWPPLHRATGGTEHFLLPLLLQQSSALPELLLLPSYLQFSYSLNFSNFLHFSFFILFSYSLKFKYISFIVHLP